MDVQPCIQHRGLRKGGHYDRSQIGERWRRIGGTLAPNRSFRRGLYSAPSFLMDTDGTLASAPAAPSSKIFLVSAGLVTSRKNAMRAPPVPSWVFTRT